VATGAEGFLERPEKWTREIAVLLAELNKLGPLTDEHFRVLEFVREYYLEHGDGPPVVRIAKATGFSSHKICELFPCGIVRGAYRLAGLPRPAGCF
jgi:tRNA 2-thiouridine synthesizing protein E